MPSDPITYIALKFPAPVCDDCCLPMVTVTAIRRHALPDVVKVIFFSVPKMRVHAWRDTPTWRTQKCCPCPFGLYAPSVSTRNCPPHSGDSVLAQTDCRKVAPAGRLVTRMMLEHRLVESEWILAGRVRDLVDEGFGRVSGVRTADDAPP